MRTWMMKDPADKKESRGRFTPIMMTMKRTGAEAMKTIMTSARNAPGIQNITRLASLVTQ